MGFNAEGRVTTKGSRRLLLAAAVLALVVAVAAPSAASAGAGGLLGKLGIGGGSQTAEPSLAPLQGLLSGGDSLDGELQSLIDDAVAELDAATQDLGPNVAGLLAETGLLGTLGDLLCPVVTSIGDLTGDIPAAAPLVDGVRDLVCNLGLLEFRFFTVWEGPGGQRIERQHDAIIGVPTALDVDGDPGPELTGTIDVGAGFDRLTLTVERAAGSTGPLPVSVEALIDDPTGGTFDKDAVAFGYDQLDDRAPDRFQAVFAVAADAGGPRFDVGVAQQGPGESTGLIGAMFDGSPHDRGNPTTVRVDYERSPTEANLGIALADPLELAVATNVVGPVVAELEDRSGGEEAGARIEIEELPNELTFALDSEAGAVAYAASAPVDRLNAVVRTTEPLFLDATEVEATFLAVPEQFELTLGRELGNLSLSADQPIGQIDVGARSDGREVPVIPDGESGVTFDATAGELGLRLRVFELEGLDVSLDPVALDAKMEGGRTFTVDAKLDQDPDDPVDTGETHVAAVIDKLPSELALGVAEVGPPTSGTRLGLAGSEPIDFVGLSVEGLELLEGADDVRLEIDEIPTEIAVELPEEGPLATIEANDHVGQLRLSASDGSGELPERTILPGDPTLNDLFGFRRVQGDVRVALRLTAIELLSVDLDPVNVSLEQDAAGTRAVDLEAGFDADGEAIDVEGLLDKPGASTSLSVDLEPDEPTRLLFDNSHKMDRFELQASGLGGIESITAAFDNLSPTMSICMDPGAACQRPNPHSVGRYATAQTTGASVDLDDFGTHGSGTGPAFRTTLNATIEFDAGDPVTITNLRFRNLGFDFQDANNPHGSNCGTVPRISMFFDSRGHPFVINSLKFPPAIVDFRIGTDGSPARARNRIARLNGWNTGFPGCITGLSTQSAGALDCGGQRALVVNTALGNINVLSFLGLQLVPVCGGTVSNPQPW